MKSASIRFQYDIYLTINCRYYEAVVEDILPESETVAVKFIEMEMSDVCQISALKPLLTDTSKSTAGTSQNYLRSKAALK